MNYSKVKDSIYEMIYLNPLHMTAEQVYEKMKVVNPKISLATVYRNLARLVEEGKIKKLTGLGEADRYDSVIYDHYHFYCEKCNEVYDLDIKDNSIIEEIQKKTEHKILEHNIVFYGICKKCLGGDKK